MKKIQVTSSVQGGALRRNRTTIKDAIKSFEGKDITITIQLKRKTRSNPQNAYLWGVVVPMMKYLIKEEWGDVYSKEDVHEILKSKFLFYEKVNEETGEVIRLPKSTTECSTVEMEEYLSSCRSFIKEWFGAIVPLPNEQITIE